MKTEECLQTLHYIFVTYEFDEEDEKKYIPINTIISTYKEDKRNKLYNDAKFVRFGVSPEYKSIIASRQRLSSEQFPTYERLKKINSEVKMTFDTENCDVCINQKTYKHCICDFHKLFEKFLNNFVTIEVIKQTVKDNPNKYKIKGELIRKITKSKQKKS